MSLHGRETGRLRTICPPREQEPNRLGLAEERGELERRESVARLRHEERGIAIQPLRDPRGVADRRRVENVELGSGREQHRDRFVFVMVLGDQDRGVTPRVADVREARIGGE